MGWLKLKGPKASFSSEILNQLTWADLRCEELFGDERIFVDTHAVYDAIGDVEDGTFRVGTPKHARFTHAGPLAGLWHKHWSQASFSYKNLFLENKTRSFQDKLWHKLIPDLLGQNWRKTSTSEDIQKAAIHQSVLGAIESRAFRTRNGGRMTGEWIIFENNANAPRRYLCLATHRQFKHFSKEIDVRLKDAKTGLFV